MGYMRSVGGGVSQIVYDSMSQQNKAAERAAAERPN